MNAVQKRYATAKAQCEAVKKQQADNIVDFIKQSGYTNPDGKIPTELYLIEDEAEFERLCDAFEKSPYDIYADVTAAEQELKEAEESLIDFGLSLVPAAVREQLESGRKIWNIREKLIDAAFRLDTKTIPEGVRV